MSSFDKGKARAASPHINTTDHPAVQTVQPHPIPSTTLLNIEYPGILSPDAGPSNPSSYRSLERALSTLHPSTLPPFTSTPHEALTFLSRIPNEGLKTVECRLGGFGSTATSVYDDGIDEMFRTPLMGEVVPTHNVVVRVVKRVWRQKRRRRSESPARQDGGVAQDREDMALDPALFGDGDAAALDGQAQRVDAQDQPNGKRSRYTGRVKKEYCVEVLGMATKTVRFRAMADFAFQPTLTATSPSNLDASSQLDPVTSLHKALATMDFAALQNFRVPEQLEDYHSSTTPPRSNLHMLPPFFFSRAEIPHNYHFSQTPYSELRTVATPPHLAKLSTKSFAHILAHPSADGSMQRFVNRVRLPNITPQQYRVGSNSLIPTGPLTDVLRIEHRCDRTILAKLEGLLEERPIWSRVALKNQFVGKERVELDGNSEKVYYALCGYAMVGGPWRDTIVRWGYDVREDVGCRVFQRVFLRGGARGEGGRETRLGKESRAVEEDEQEAAVVPNGDARSSPLETKKSTHLFDGTTLHRHVGNFQLCDIHDPLIQPYIHQTDDAQIQWLRREMDPETGWYTRRALDLIRALVAARFKALADTRRPLEKSALDEIVQRMRGKWREEDEVAREVETCTQQDAQQGRMDVDPDLV
ncbi:hypothetical protein PHSY_001658 [Pseudozyma hubeiensis SY62]|uniref:Uncharacterized protein n=1 Tax=Pseudozyma hubeiensis (strain SY62) TaxID=1305764 RepID=R9NZA2_PSEHS|nr:hypothetical protein PHSY_001658 [Pseudozyma hubeiensis SY62]GAC94089.1 hypothetical protein PHSY_001658 [Pseudozyma hubeiensis SY62]